MGYPTNIEALLQNGDNPFSLNFDAVGMKFDADTVSSLVVSNGMAVLQGTGTFNDVSGYNFLVTGVDGGGIRIQITNRSSHIVYDTQPEDPVTAIPTTAVNGHVKVQ